MTSSVEYLLKAENYAIAAQGAQTLAQRAIYIRASAMCRNKWLRLELGARAGVLRESPFGRDELKAH